MINLSISKCWVSAGFNEFIVAILEEIILITDNMPFITMRFNIIWFPFDCAEFYMNKIFNWFISHKETFKSTKKWNKIWTIS